MTEEIIQSITAAEIEAANIKQAALEKAAQILLNAENSARGTENSAAETCKAYAISQNKQAQEDAETEYAAAMRKAKKDAQSYCEEALQNAENFIGTIIGRILRGDR
jgi:vacuolar-type H+-ATPase subunit H